MARPPILLLVEETGRDWIFRERLESQRGDELERLDRTIDPRGLRFLEALTGAARRERLRALASENAPA